MDRKKAIPGEWSRHRTRHDPPSLDKAIAAAQGLTDRIENRVAIAAQLIGLPEDELRRRVLMAQAQPGRGRAALARGRRTQVLVMKRRGGRTS